MKKTPIIILLLISSAAVFAQKKPKEEFYMFDSNMKGVTKPDSAGYLMRVTKFADTLWQFDTYHTYGPLTSTEQYRDQRANSPSGRFTFYHSSGFLDSTGMVINGRLDGDWNFCNDTGGIITQKKYAMGKLIKVRDLLQEDRDKKLKEEQDKKEGVIADTFKRDEKESEFAGGLGGWKRYLIKNLRYPERAVKSNISGRVYVQFVVDTEGKATDITIFKSVEYSLDQEAMRILQESPKWTPAWQDGRVVKSYKRQPIIFQLQ
ncbi:energy transducer TonB [Flavitalea sp.]|nr:TonB family protein [Flavitalea sp.]